MRIGIDARTLSVKGGPRTYVLNLIEALNKIDESNEYVIYYDNKCHVGTFPGIKEVVVKLPNKALCLLWDQILLPMKHRTDDVDLIHNTKSAGSLFNNCKSVITIHDIIPIIFPETEKILNRLYWGVQIPLAAKYADHIITVSDASKKDIMSHFNISDEKISVIYNATNNNFKVITDIGTISMVTSKYHLPDKYILCVGTIQPRKNLKILIKAFSKLQHECNIKHKLVIAGRKGWLYKDIIELIDKLKIENDIIFTGFIDDNDLPLIYNAADLFVYPSFYEGFGIPPLEAMACGTPVITSNTSSLPEVVGDAGIMIDPHDLDGLTQAMYDVLTNDDLRENMIKKGLERSKLFSWEKTARETLKVYESVVNGQ